jgi:hypothetical protein
MGGGVSARRYDENGVSQWGQFLVNTTTANSQKAPAVAALPNDGFVVTWMSFDGADWGVFGQRYDAVGVIGGEFAISATSDPRLIFRSFGNEFAGRRLRGGVGISR